MIHGMFHVLAAIFALVARAISAEGLLGW